MKIAVGQGSCGIAAGAQKAYDVLNSSLDLNKNQLTFGVHLIRKSCNQHCNYPK